MNLIHPHSGDYLDCLSSFPHYLGNAWRELAPGRGYFGDPSHLEGGIRTMGNVVYVAGLLAGDPHFRPAPGATDRTWLLEKARASLAYMTHGHITGDSTCGDGQKWGGVWQSAWWTTRMALGARQIWSELHPTEQAEVERVVVFEADLQLPRIVPSGLAEDTKAEENAWDAEILATAVALFPDHPHRALWWEKLCEFAYNTFSIATDRYDSRLADGRPLKERVYTVNLYSDFTLENHGAYHFCYVASPFHSLAWASYALLGAGITPPEALYHHVADVWKIAKPTFLRDRFAYVGGQDWARYTYGNYFIVPALVWLQSHLDDPDLRAIETARFRCLREEQAENNDGSFFGKRFTQPDYFGQPAKYETDCYANMALAYQLHRLAGAALKDNTTPLEAPADPLVWQSQPEVLPLSGRLVSQESGIAYVRTPKLFASFSWKTLTEPDPIALFIPVGREELAEWQPGNLFGRVVLPGAPPSAVWIRAMREEGDGFRIAGTVIYRGRNGQILFTQELEYAVDPETGIAQVRSRFTASQKIWIQRVEGLRLAIVNDRWNGFGLDLHHVNGTMPLHFDPERRPFWLRRSDIPSRIVRKLLRETMLDGSRKKLPGRWVNVDGAYGIIATGKEPQNFELYQPTGRNLPDGSLHFELLFCPLRFENRTFAPGEEILNVEFTLVAGDAEATRKLAESLL